MDTAYYVFWCIVIGFIAFRAGYLYRASKERKKLWRIPDDTTSITGAFDEELSRWPGVITLTTALNERASFVITDKRRDKKFWPQDRVSVTLVYRLLALSGQHHAELWDAHYGIGESDGEETADAVERFLKDSQPRA